MEQNRICKCQVCGVEFTRSINKTISICNKCQTHGSDTKESICSKCGLKFLLYRNPNDDNKFEKKKLCPNCRGRHCQICGKSINDNNTKICEDCKQKLNLQTITKDTEKKIIGCFTRITNDGHYFSKCSKCGCEIEVNPKNKNNCPDGKCRKLCDKCYNEFMNETQEHKCKICGKTLIATRSITDGGFLTRMYCQDCYEKLYPRKYNPPKFKLRECECCHRMYRQYPNTDGSFTESKKYCPDCSFNNPIIQQTHSTTTMQKYGVKWSCLSKVCQDARDNVQPHDSKVNQKFADLLSNNNIVYKQEYIIQQNGYRRHYDFYIPSIDCLIEINPTYTHSSIGNVYSGYDADEKHKTYRKWYHLNRTQDVDKRVIHVWDWDSWEQIINLIKPKTKIYARNLKINTVSDEDSKVFLNKHHLQGNCRCKDVKLGLYDKNNNLIELMVFGKPRYNKNYQWELLRLCTHSDNVVIGGANKLFKYFILNYTPESVLSYCDNSKFSGDVYEKMGFKFIRLTYPSKTWCKNNLKITDNLLRQRGFDQLVGSKLNPPEIYGKGTNNEELMLKHGWLPIFDCGQKVFEWRCKENK